MFSKTTVDRLSSNISKADSIIKLAEKYSRTIVANQMKHHLNELKDEYSKIHEEENTKAWLSMTFGGKPAKGSIGIDAKFSGEILKEIQELINKCYNKVIGNELGIAGRIPYKDEANLLVTDVVHGSFGFLLEETKEQSEAFDTILFDAVSEATRLINGVSSESETDFEGVLEELDSRVIDSLKSVFNVLGSNSASINLKNKTSDYMISEERIRLGKERINNVKVDEHEESREGSLLLYAPSARVFEFVTNDGVRIIGKSASVYHKILSELIDKRIVINYKQSTIQLKFRNVLASSGMEKTVFTLQSLDFTDADIQNIVEELRKEASTH